jgi:hypothetical protein
MFTWIIERLDCVPAVDGKQDYVVMAYWRCNATDQGFYASHYGTCGFTVAEGDSFIPYADLTQDDVLGWCWANGVDKDATETNVQKELDSKINPPVVAKPLPWSSAA